MHLIIIIILSIIIIVIILMIIRIQFIYLFIMDLLLDKIKHLDLFITALHNFLEPHIFFGAFSFYCIDSSSR